MPKKGSDLMIDMMRKGLSGMVRRRGGAWPSTVTVEIEFYNKARKLVGNYELKDNNYIDAFISKKILEVLKSYDDYKIIAYKGTDSEDLEIIYGLSEYRSLFTPYNDEHNVVAKESNIKDIEIKNLNTFAIFEKEELGHIYLPKKLKFELTLKENSQVADESKSPLQHSINKEIDEKIDEELKKETAPKPGGKKSKKLPKKEILGKIMCIYKIPGDRKEYVRHKGKLITVKDYKELMKAKKAKKKQKKAN